MSKWFCRRWNVLSNKVAQGSSSWKTGRGWKFTNMVPDNTIKVRGLKSASFTYRSVKVINKISNIKISNTMICKKKKQDPWVRGQMSEEEVLKFKVCLCMTSRLHIVWGSTLWPSFEPCQFEFLMRSCPGTRLGSRKITETSQVHDKVSV